MTIRDKLGLLERRAAEAELGGGAARLKAQHDKGKLSARERLDILLDEGSFVELDRFVLGLEARRAAAEFGLCGAALEQAKLVSHGHGRKGNTRVRVRSTRSCLIPQTTAVVLFLSRQA